MKIRDEHIKLIYQDIDIEAIEADVTSLTLRTKLASSE